MTAAGGRAHLAASSPARLMADLAPPEALRRLELTIVRRLEGYLRGDHLGLLPGPGSDLADAIFRGIKRYFAANPPLAKSRMA